MLSLNTFDEVRKKRNYLSDRAFKYLFTLAGNMGEIKDPEQIDENYIKEVCEKDLPPFEEYLGGKIFIIQNKGDLKEVQGVDMDFGDKYGRWPNITEKVLGWDSAEYLDEEWALIFICWNDNGGPTYLIPRHLWEKSKMDQQIKFTNETW